MSQQCHVSSRRQVLLKEALKQNAHTMPFKRKICTLHATYRTVKIEEFPHKIMEESGRGALKSTVWPTLTEQDAWFTAKKLARRQLPEGRFILSVSLGHTLCSARVG